MLDYRARWLSSLVLLGWALPACSNTSAGGGPCSSDADCSGDQICVDGSCADPSTTTGPTSSTVGTGSTSSTGSTTGTTDPSTTGTSTDPTTAETGTDTVGGCQLDSPPGDPCAGVGVGPGCNILDQDCPAGEKCVPWADGGGSWNSTKCVAIDPNPKQVFDVCTTPNGATSGEDDCDAGLMCWNVDSQTMEGYCIELCGCSGDMLSCDTPETFCSVSNGGVLPMCFPLCDPLEDTCQGNNEACVPRPGEDYFFCSPSAGGVYGDACVSLSSCGTGFVCTDGVNVPNCADNCCTAFCDLDAPNTCPDAADGQECIPWFEQGMEPSCLEHVGMCGIP